MWKTAIHLGRLINDFARLSKSTLDSSQRLLPNGKGVGCFWYHNKRRFACVVISLGIIRVETTTKKCPSVLHVKKLDRPCATDFTRVTEAVLQRNGNDVRQHKMLKTMKFGKSWMIIHPLTRSFREFSMKCTFCLWRKKHHQTPNSQLCSSKRT